MEESPNKIPYTFWEKAGWVLFGAGVLILVVIIPSRAHHWKPALGAAIASALLMGIGLIIIKGGWNDTRSRWITFTWKAPKN